MPKKILVADDSALMRRILCDIITSDERFEVADMASDGEETLNLIKKNKYDTVILDVNMPKKSGIEVLKEIRKQRISVKVVMVSTLTKEGAAVTLEALELGAVDFAHKPSSILDAKAEEYRQKLLDILRVTTSMGGPAKIRTDSETGILKKRTRINEVRTPKEKERFRLTKNKKLVAIASSTGGPKALQSIIPKLPAGLDAPVVVVQHMPKGFTESLAERLNGISELGVKEAKEGDVLEKGNVYIARGGSHLKMKQVGEQTVLQFSDEAPREGVKPCANFLYESIIDTDYEQVVCVVMTGMGTDGTEGIRNLIDKQGNKKIVVLAQDEESCVVYGMPRSVVKAGLADEIVPLESIAKEIIGNVGVNEYGCKPIS